MNMKLAATDKNLDLGLGKPRAARRVPSGFPAPRRPGAQGTRVPGFTGTMSLPYPAETAARLYFRMIRAAELAEWEATGGDVLRSE